MKKTMTVLFGLCLMLILSWAQASAFTGFSPFPGGGGGSSNQIGTLTDGKWCTYSSSTGKISCTEDAPAGAGDVTDVGDCAGGACYDGTSDGGTYVRLYDGTSAYASITAGVRTLTLAPSNSNAENMVITFGDNNNALALSSGTGATSVTLTGLDLTVAGGDITLISATAGAGVSAGDGTLTLSGLGSGTDETLTIDLNSADLITLASGTSATFAFTPAVGFTGRTTHSAGLTVADAQTIIFDESASEPDDADLVISGSDGVLTIASANGVNNENITIDLDATSNVATFNSGTSATFTLTPATTITGQLTLSANPRIYDGDSHYLTLDVADLSGAVTLALGATYTDTKWCSYSSTTGLTCNEEIPATAANDVTGVGDCASGACLDGSSDGGSYIRLYDGNSHYTSIAAGDSTGNVTVKLPTADGISGQYIKTDGSGQWSWGDPAGSGTITAVGNFSTGAAFTTDATQNGILYFEGSTANDYEIALTAANATADRTITLSDETGTVMLGPSGLGTDNRLMKTDGTGNLVQITGITVDDSDNVSGVGTFGLAGAMTISANSAAITHSGTTTLAITSTSGTVSVESITFTGDAVTGASNVTSTKLTSTELEYGGNISLDALNAAANSTITLNNSDGTYVANVTMEGDATVQGGDLVLISATAGATITGGNGTITLAGTGSGQDESLVLNFNSTADTIVLTSGSSAATINANAFSISSNGLVPDAGDGAAIGSTSAEWSDLYLADGGVIYGQNDQSATLTSSASTWTASALTSTGTLTANGNTAVGDADTDTLTVRSRVIGGNSRAVWIDDDETTVPTYATATNELYVEGDVETVGNMYAASFVTGAGTDGQRRATLTSNTSFDCATYPDSVYFLNDALMFCNSTSSKTPMRLEDSQTATGKKTFQADIAVGDASNAGSIDIYDGSSNYWVIAVPSLAANYTMTLPTDDGTSGQYLQTDGSGVLSWGTPSATAAGATAGMIQYNASGTGGALAGDAGFLFTTATDKLTLGESGGSTTGTIDLYYTGTTYAATVQPNSGMAADVTLTLPSYTTTMLGAGANTFTGNQTLDDGTGDSPTIVFQDATDTTMTMVKSDNAWFSMTPSSATYGLNVLTGNLKVGNGAPTQTLNGEDGYIEGLFEVDGAAYLDGGASIGTSLAFPATLSSAAAVTWTVMDDQTSGLTIGATDKADILKIISTNSGEGVSMSGTLAVTGITTFSANPRIYDGNSNYATLDTPDISGDITITLPSVASTLAILGANTFTGDQLIYDAVNDGNPVWAIGAAAAERLSITATYETGGQLLESVTFNTTTADGDADDGEMIFQVDDVEIARFKDSGPAFALVSTFATSADPDSDGGATLGTKNTAEWQNLYLNTGGTIEFENGDVTLTHSANTLTLGGGTLALGSNSLTMTGSIGETGSRVTKGWFTDLEVTNAIAGSVTGNAGTATALAADPSNCTAGQIALGVNASGVAECTATPSGLTSVGATTFTGALTGTASGNIANTLADAAGDLIQGSADNTWAKLTKGATGTLIQAGESVHAATTYALPVADCSENQILKANSSGDFICAADADTGGATALNAIGDAAADGEIAAAGYETLITSTLDEADHSVLKIINTDADRGNDTTILTLSDNDGADANAFYLKLIGDADGTPATYLSISQTTVLSGALAWDLGGATSFEPPNSDDPDIDATGEISFDTDGWLRVYETSQKALARIQEEIHVTVVKPQDMADAVRDAFLVWSNESGMTFTVTGWKAWSGTDNTTLNIETTDGTGGTNATVDAVEIASDGTGCFYASDGTITAATIANGSLIWLDFDDTDDPTYVKLVIYGYYNADVN